MTTETAIITGTDFVTVPTEDWEKAKRFYGEVLGLPFSKHGNMLDLHHRYAPGKPDA